MAVTINSVDCRFSTSSMSSVWGDWKSIHINALFLIIQHIKLWSELSWEGEQRIVHVKHMWVGAGKGDHFPFPPWVCYCIRRMHSTGKAVLGTVLSGWPWFRRPLSFFSPLSFTALQGEGQKNQRKNGMLPCGCVLKHHLHQDSSKAFNSLLWPLESFSFAWLWITCQLCRSTFSTSALSSGVEQSSVRPVEKHILSHDISPHPSAFLALLFSKSQSWRQMKWLHKRLKSL